MIVLVSRHEHKHNPGDVRIVSSKAVQPIVALISDSVGGNPTQYMVEKAFAHHDLDWRYLTAEVSPGNLADAIRGIRALGFSGGHCGNPHKEAVLPLLDRTTETVDAIGAANLMFRDGEDLVGENTEGRGLVDLLGRVTDSAEKRVVLLGAGHAARAVGIELARAGAVEITVVDRTEERGGELAGLLAGKFHVAASAVIWQDQYEVPPETDLLVNATSLGAEDPDAVLPIQIESLTPQMIVADMTTDPPRTWLLREAQQRGCTTLDGLGMFIEQVAIGIKIWTGVDPDRDVMRDAVEEFLEL